MENSKNLYKNKIIKQMHNEFKYKSIMQVPKITKIVANIGLGSFGKDKKILDTAINDLTLITSQKAVVTKAKNSNASFKIRANVPMGCKVTLHGNKMYNFIDKLVNIAIPRIRDFQGLKLTSFDANYNYSIGIKEYIIFPEINYDKVEKMLGLDITIVTSAKSKKEAISLLSYFNFPLMKGIKNG